MPIDAQGNRAEIIMDGDSTIKRMNGGRLYEQWINAVSREVTNRVRQWMQEPSAENIQRSWEYVLGYYKIVSPRMYDLLTGPGYTGDPAYHVREIVRDGIYLYLPTDNPAEGPTIIEELEKHYPLPISPVTYRGRSGHVRTTVEPILIGSMYIILLEKTGGDWSGVASSKLQVFGMPARLTKNDKHSAPGRAQPVRLLGESEVRLFSAFCGGEITAELLEMSNSPTTHRHLVAQLLRADKPTNIENIIDRKEAPRGRSRSHVFVNHALETAGVRFVDTSDKELRPAIYPPESL